MPSVPSIAAAAIAARTLAGAVPPKLVRLATEASTISTPYTRASIRASIACSSLGKRVEGLTPFLGGASPRGP